MEWFLLILGIFFYVRLSGRLTDIERRLGDDHRDTEYTLQRSSALTDEGDENEQQAEEVSVGETTPQPITPVPDLDPPPPPPAPPAQEPVVKKGGGFSEENIGSKLFPLIGGIAILLGMGFLLKYAIDQGWITEVIRIFLGYLIGALFIVLGEWMRKKYTEYSNLLSGIGIALLYLMTFGAYSWYGLISQPIAFLLSLIVSAFSIFLALRYDARILAGMGFAGGYLAPFILPPETSSPYSLFSYISIISFALLVVASRRSWVRILWGGLAGTFGIYFMWAAQFYHKDVWLPAILFSTLFFLLFTLFGAKYFIRALEALKAKNERDEGAAVLALFTGSVGLLYFFAGYDIAIEFSRLTAALFTLLLALFYTALAALAHYQYKNAEARQIFTLFAAVVFAIIPPIGFQSATLSVLWALEAVAIFTIGALLYNASMRFLGILTACATAFYTFILFFFKNSALSQPIINSAFISKLFVVAAFAVMGILYRMLREKINEGLDADPEQASGGLITLSALLFYIAVGIEISAYFELYFLTLFTVVFSLCLLALNRYLRFIWLSRLAILFIAFLVPLRLLPVLFDSAAASTPIFNTDVLELSLAILGFIGAGYLHSKTHSAHPEAPQLPGASLALIVTGVLLAYITGIREIHVYLEPYWYTYYIATLSLLVTAWGGRANIAVLRTIGYSSLLALTGWLLFFGEAHRGASKMPFLNFHFFEYLILAAALYVCATLLRQHVDVDEGRAKVEHALFMLAHVLVIYGVSMEIIYFFAIKIDKAQPEDKNAATLKNIRNVLLSVWWMVYAFSSLFFGIIKKSRIARLIGLALLWITIFKVFLLDTANLDTLYRFISFILLGTILLLAGYLYNRHREKIQRFLNTPQ